MGMEYLCELHLVQRCAHNKNLIALFNQTPGRVTKLFGYTDRAFNRDAPSNHFVVIKPEDYTGAW